MFAWVIVGISTFFDEDGPKEGNASDKPKDSTSV
jgi:hypothetical protein